MPDGNVEIVRGIFELWAKGDFRGGVDAFDPQVMFIVRNDFPEPGTFIGPDEVRRYLRVFLEQWDELAIEAEHVRATGDTVIVTALQHAKGRASGLSGDLRYFQLFTFRGGRIVRIESILEEGDALEAAGLSE